MKNKDDLKDIEKLTKLQSEVKQRILKDKLGKQGFHYDTKQIFEPITKAFTAPSQHLLEDIKINTKAIKNLDESEKYVKILELMNKNGTVHHSLMRPIAKLLGPKIKVNFNWRMTLIVKIGMISYCKKKKLQKRR